MDSDSESQSSRCSSLRNQDISSIGSRASSVGSCPSQEWFQIAQFDQISLLDQFILTNMPQNPVRDSKPQIWINVTGVKYKLKLKNAQIATRPSFFNLKRIIPHPVFQNQNAEFIFELNQLLTNF